MFYLEFKGKELESFFKSGNRRIFRQVNFKYNRNIWFIVKLIPNLEGSTFLGIKADYDPRKVSNISYDCELRLKELNLRIRKAKKSKELVCWDKDTVQLDDIRDLPKLTFSMSFSIDWIQYRTDFKRRQVTPVSDVVKPCKMMKQFVFQYHVKENETATLKGGQCLTMNGPDGSEWIFYLFPKGKERKPKAGEPCASLYGNLLRFPPQIKSIKYHLNGKVSTAGEVIMEKQGEYTMKCDNPVTMPCAAFPVWDQTKSLDLEVTFTITEMIDVDDQLIDFEGRDSIIFNQFNPSSGTFICVMMQIIYCFKCLCSLRFIRRQICNVCFSVHIASFDGLLSVHIASFDCNRILFWLFMT